MNSAIILVTLVLNLLAAGMTYADTCAAQPEDERTYILGLSGTYFPFSYLNENGELDGMFVDGLKMICGIMSKKCKPVVTPLSSCWDYTNTSIGLNNRWFDGCAGLHQTAARRSAMGFVAEFTNVLGQFIYVKKGSGINRIEDIRRMGFVRGTSVTPSCVQRSLGLSLDNIIIEYYPSSSERNIGILSDEIDSFIAYPRYIRDAELVDRVDTKPITGCSLGGLSVMVRKDMVQEMSWMDEGLQKLKDNGDYKWMCNIAKKNFGVDDTAC